MEVSQPSQTLCAHSFVIPGNLYFGYKVWTTTKFLFLAHLGDKGSDIAMASLAMSFYITDCWLNDCGQEQVGV